jgi:hypothetical protein
MKLTGSTSTWIFRRPLAFSRIFCASRWSRPLSFPLRMSCQRNLPLSRESGDSAGPMTSAFPPARVAASYLARSPISATDFFPSSFFRQEKWSATRREKGG